MTSKEILDKLLKKYSTGGWMRFVELRMGTGYGGDRESRIDFFVAHEHPSKGNMTIAFEIKVSKSDFSREKNNPKKNRLAKMYSNRFYYVTPPGLLKPSSIPIGCGLMEATDNGITTILECVENDRCRPRWNFTLALARHVREYHNMGCHKCS